MLPSPCGLLALRSLKTGRKSSAPSDVVYLTRDYVITFIVEVSAIHTWAFQFSRFHWRKNSILQRRTQKIATYQKGHMCFPRTQSLWLLRILVFWILQQALIRSLNRSTSQAVSAHLFSDEDSDGCINRLSHEVSSTHPHITVRYLPKLCVGATYFLCIRRAYCR